jgi:hypothetical protein
MSFVSANTTFFYNDLRLYMPYTIEDSLVDGL